MIKEKRKKRVSGRVRETKESEEMNNKEREPGTARHSANKAAIVHV